jgi:organic radical activating enzyme
MRVFDKQRRIPLYKENELSTFNEELNYYREYNQFPVTLFGKPIINIYKNINVQAVVTRRCNYRCGFCIENDDLLENTVKEIPSSELLGEVLRQYAEQGVKPHVSITGGEPTLFPGRLRDIIAVCNSHGVKRLNINTNGTKLAAIADLNGFLVNLSRHHYQRSKIEEIFEHTCEDVPLLPKKTVMQCVLLAGYVDNLHVVKQYMSHYISQGAVGFSFRGLSALDSFKEYSRETSWTAAHEVDVFAFANAVAADPEFEFVQQKIGDHYWFEIYKYKGFPMRVTYSNFSWLRDVETKERSKGEWFSRVTVVSPFNKVYAGWTYDINEVYSKPELVTLP